MKDLKNTLIYQHFAKTAKPAQITLIDEQTEAAAAELKLVRDTFPTYTLHDEVHAINVVSLMGKLLGSKLTELSPLECAVLMLSAYYHDIGMVFNEEERDELQNEIDFEKFLEENPDARLKIKKFQNEDKENEDKIPDDVAEWYCRWIHPDRAYNYLLAQEDILWEGYPINEEIAIVCKSHGYPVAEVHGFPEIKTEFHEGADLFFCSILLRLADILDFDNSRSPKQIYQYLGLTNEKSKRDKTSNKEWQKHYSSQGFIFTPNPSDDGYSLKFMSHPDNPAVEYDIKEFLKMIEKELTFCSEVLKLCSDRWRNFILPAEINKKEIKSKGYHYGEFRFTLEQEQILELLMGENLYSDKYAFIRELAQNAMDSTRHREIYEKNKGNTEFVPEPIIFSTWFDDDGYTWIRIDDYGMGMDEDIILKFFLKIGKSYYQSSQFELEQMNWKSNKDFMPISRFGIGILSCFIMSDSIELSTRRVTDKAEKNAIRLSMKEIDGFFVMKKEGDLHTPSNMPNENKKAEKYRSKNNFGTSISLRLNPRKEDVDFSLKKTLESYIVAPPIPVILDGEMVGGDYHNLIEKKWCEYKEYPIEEEDINKMEEVLKYKFTEAPVLLQIPLDLTANSPSENFKGQAVIFYIKLSEKDRGIFLSEVNIPRGRRIGIYRYKNNNIQIEVSYGSEKRYIISCPVEDELVNYLPSNNLISHNGIYVPSRNRNVNEIKFRINNPYFGEVYYRMAFKDNLRFDLSLSRDELKKVNWNIYSVVQYTFLKTLSKMGIWTEFSEWNLFFNRLHGIDFSMGDIQKDILINSGQHWVTENIFNIESDNCNILQIRNLASAGDTYIILPANNQNKALNICKKALIQNELNIELITGSKKIKVIDSNKPNGSMSLGYYSPLFFLKYDNNKQLRNYNNPINSEHPFSNWLIKNTEILNTKYPAILSAITALLSRAIWWRGAEYKEEEIKSIEKIVDGINKILDRLKTLNYEDKPTKSIYLKIEDFVK